jgi:hypothetical protein
MHSKTAGFAWRRWGERPRLWKAHKGRIARPGIQLVGHDHGVNLVNANCEDHPEYGRHEKAANDIDYSMGLEKGWRRASAGAAVGEAFEPGL